MTPSPPRQETVDRAVLRLRAWLEKPLALDLTRGKPAPEQLDLSDRLLAYPKAAVTQEVDLRNYGGTEGLAEARKLFAGILDVPWEQVLVGDNASLTLMYQALQFALLHGVPGGDGPWLGQKPKILCPSPGYDRHFTAAEHLGYELVTTPISERDGLDVEAIERLAAEDASVKGVWIVPKFSNPTGYTLTPEEVDALARLRAA
ncbi:MAG: aminotransferase class I/II-fold pyridoxal phosphate-dependent enzyme, partial [Myxococcota bacterium]